MNEPWLFRVASHRSQGGGHIERSSVLARELARMAPVQMVLDPNSPEASARLEAAGLPYVTVGEEGAGPWVGAVVDGYRVLEVEAARISQRVRPMVWIDDFLDAPDSADLLINGACHLSGEQVGGIPALLGSNFALVDPRFAALPDRDRARPVERVLVTFGRLDPSNATGLALDALDVLAKDGIAPAVTVVSSAASPYIGDLRERANRRVTIMTDIADMAPRLADADLVIGAGGVSLMERMAAGVPSATLLIADNQRLFIEGAAAQGGTLNAGAATHLSREDFALALRPLIAQAEYRTEMAAAGRRLIDGRGAARVAALLVDFARSWRPNGVASVTAASSGPH